MKPSLRPVCVLPHITRKRFGRLGPARREGILTDMPLPIEDYALIGDGNTAALIGRDGSIDWMCVPRFDSPACFAALLGGPDHGRWLLAPQGGTAAARRTYRGDTLILESEFQTSTGAVRILDFMCESGSSRDVVRIVEGRHGRVSMHMELVVRFDYGHIVPWVRRSGGAIYAIAGPDTIELRTPVHTRGERMKTVAEFEVVAGQRVPFVLRYRASHDDALPALDAEEALAGTDAAWHAWSGQNRYEGKWRAPVMRSLITLKALIYRPTGGIIAAPTTSLPEAFGGVRNWDYRYCWLRDATFTLNTLLLAGYTDEAVAWREWLSRAVAGSARDLQILYSVTGERRLPEAKLAWLPGYGNAAPVRIGNAASEQFQLDVFGEVMDSLHLARAVGLEPPSHVWQVQKALLEFLDGCWRDPDEGIWEIRGPRRQFTHSKVMAWVAYDRAVKAVERFGLQGPVAQWRRTRDEIHAQVCQHGYNAERRSFVQHDETTDLDASLLLIPAVGFLPPDDPRVVSTIEAVERELLVEGLVLRYPTASGVDGLPAGEGVFLPCTFWLADSLALIGRRTEAEALFERLVALCNDVGLLSEEFDPASKRMLGNFPQALTHMALVNTARLLSMPHHEIASSCAGGERPTAAN